MEPSIAFISPFAYPLLSREGYPGGGGAERQLLLYGRGLRARGWRVSFICQIPEEPAETVLPVHPARFGYLGGAKGRLPGDWLSLFRAMAAADADWYVLKTPMHLLAPMRLFCHLRSRRLLLWGQTTHLQPVRAGRPGLRVAGWLDRLGLGGVDLVLAQTQEQARVMADSYGVHPRVLPSIEAPLGEIPEPIESAPAPVDLLWVGNSSSNKRVEVALELARRLPQRDLVVAMLEVDPDRYKRIEKTCGELQNVRFLGAQPERSMGDWYGRARLLLCTSRREGLPNVFLQAWRHRVPVVSLGIDPDGVIQEQGLGRVVEPGPEDDPARLAELLAPAVEELLSDPEERRRMGERARAHLAEHHVPEVVMPRLLALLGGTPSEDPTP